MAEGAVADREERDGESTLAEVAQDAGPGLGALAVAELHRQEFFLTVRACADDDEEAGVLRRSSPASRYSQSA